MEAIISIGGKQYNISEGKVIKTEKIKNIKEGEEFEIKDALAIIKDGKITVGTAKANIVLRKIKDIRGKKIIVFKFKRKKRYRRKYGHRQWYSILKVEKVNAEVG